MSEAPGTKDKRAGRPNKSEVVTVRLDPRLKYLAELAARRQRRPLSSYIEWAVEQSLSRVDIDHDDHNHEDVTIAQMASTLWDVDERERFVTLVFRYPELLTHEEQLLWRLIRENGFLWRGSYKNADQKWRWKIENGNLIMDRLRDHWGTFLAVVRGEKDQSDLPTWTERATKDDLDDEIPY
jgi:hypothetical protein